MNSLMQDSGLIALCRRIPALADAVNIRALEGGLSNKNYRIDTATNSYVMRVGAAGQELLGIDRVNEIINTHSAWRAGVGPAVIDSLPDEQVLVLGWIDAKTLHATDLQTQPVLLSRIAQALRTLHSATAFQGRFHFPTIRNNYLKKVLKEGYFLPDRYLDFEPLVLELERLLAAHAEPLVPCNNDLLAENFLDDGEKIWIIDYEYSGQNEASFDIGNLAGESFLPDEQLALLCDAYWQEHIPLKLARAKAWSMIARFGWVLWASIQEAISPISFGFRSWGMRKWDSVMPELCGEPYQILLKQLKHDHS
jgi:thiamine kinase-like enzyme